MLAALNPDLERLKPMKDVAFLLFPDVLLLDVAGPIEMFTIASRYQFG